MCRLYRGERLLVDGTGDISHWRRSGNMVSPRSGRSPTAGEPPLKRLSLRDMEPGLGLSSRQVVGEAGAGTGASTDRGGNKRGWNWMRRSMPGSTAESQAPPRRGSLAMLANQLRTLEAGQTAANHT